ncbi:hypothetical protein CDD80_6623 [Ophiocordyceps camponoti-rufipedis]|uniref:HTH La-type RNA-binding domain-containing protein n=1 Tax=Ophiocordyceps camponoti-rufipedis TaxID=2004952 RepID=A0A2C5ZHA0_9HYPO|nr:hypothetical protein CDD80_6623 [Ophiocordyceps camponoti-rufipedis]
MSEPETTAKPAEADRSSSTVADEHSQLESEKPQSVKTEPDLEEKMQQTIKAEPGSEDGNLQTIKADPGLEEEKRQFIKAEPDSEEGKPQSIKAEPEVEDKKTQSAIESEDAKEKTVEPTPIAASTEQSKSKEEPAGTAPDVTTAPEVTTTETKTPTDRSVYQNNRKFDPSVREVTDDPVAIRKQVEFYFGDWNFPQDKFMWESCGGTANKPMPISKIHSFKRMRTFQPYSAIVAALRESSFLEVVGDEGQEMVKRKVGYKPMAEARAKAEAATVYAKGFGDENPDTQFDLESFFGKYGEIKGLKLRRTNEGLFKGSVFVTFPDVDAAKKFVDLKPAPTYKGNDLKIMLKRDYCDEKSELIRQGKLEPSNNGLRKKFFEGKDSTRRGSRDNRQPGGDDWKKRREQDQKNGFQDRRDGGRGRGARGRDRGRGRGRGGGRGGRDGAGRGRGGRDGGDRRDNTNDVKPPRIQSTADESSAGPATAGSKRARDEAGAPDEAPAAKKVDIKEEIKTEET